MRRCRHLPLSLALVLLPISLACGNSEPQGGARPANAGPGGERPAQPPIPVAIQPAITGPIAAYYTATATLEAQAEAEVLARVSGLVSSLSVEEGDAVGANQTLLRVGNDEYRLRVDQAAASVANLQSKYDRMEEMAARKLVSAEEFDAAKNELATAKANEGLARLDLSYTRVQAPFEGIVTQRLVDAGENVAVGTPLFRIADFTPLLARVHVPSKEFRRLEQNQSVRLTLDSTQQELSGSITLVSPIIDPTSGTIKLTIEIPSYPAGTRPGDFAEVSIVTELRENVTLVPSVAVVTDKGEDTVYVVLDDTAERRVVELGFTDGQHSQVLSGVAVGDQVVVKGQRSLKNGSPVKVLEDAIANTAMGR